VSACVERGRGAAEAFRTRVSLGLTVLLQLLQFTNTLHTSSKLCCTNLLLLMAHWLVDRATDRIRAQ
jgi:TRAP-type C4-dicarboxylate transport system permease small subunit